MGWDWSEILRQGGLLAYGMGITYWAIKLWNKVGAKDEEIREARKELVSLMIKSLDATNNAVRGVNDLEEAIAIKQTLRDMDAKLQSRTGGADGR